MRFAIVSWHLPEAEGSAAGRVLRATYEGLVAEGHEVRVRSWRTEPPAGDLPTWCEWLPVEVSSGGAARARSLLRPRSAAAGVDIAIADDEVAVADEFLSFPAIRHAARRVLTLHYLTALDARATASRTLAQLQDRRAERAATRRAGLVLAYSPRVAGSAGKPARFVPAAYPVPPAVPPAVTDPVAGVLADWGWPPNRIALDRLLGLWPDVRRRVAGARLILAGRGLGRVGTQAGVEVWGEVASSADVLAGTAVVPFPCPPTSGPKMKVLEALAHGRPVVTTPAGVEGLVLEDRAGVVVSSYETMAADLAALLADPERRAAMATAGRRAVLEHHAPVPAARARVAACSAAGW